MNWRSGTLSAAEIDELADELEKIIDDLEKLLRDHGIVDPETEFSELRRSLEILKSNRRNLTTTLNLQDRRYISEALGRMQNSNIGPEKRILNLYGAILKLLNITVKKE